MLTMTALAALTGAASAAVAAAARGIIANNTCLVRSVLSRIVARHPHANFGGELRQSAAVGQDHSPAEHSARRLSGEGQLVLVIAPPKGCLPL